MEGCAYRVGKVQCLYPGLRYMSQALCWSVRPYSMYAMSCRWIEGRLIVDSSRGCVISLELPFQGKAKRINSSLDLLVT
jgi:hypothetical protein